MKIRLTKGETDFFLVAIGTGNIAVGFCQLLVVGIEATGREILAIPAVVIFVFILPQDKDDVGFIESKLFFKLLICRFQAVPFLGEDVIVFAEIICQIVGNRELGLCILQLLLKIVYGLSQRL